MKASWIMAVCLVAAASGCGQPPATVTPPPDTNLGAPASEPTSSGSMTSVPDDLAPSTEPAPGTSEERGPALPEPEGATKPEGEPGT